LILFWSAKLRKLIPALLLFVALNAGVGKLHYSLQAQTTFTAREKSTAGEAAFELAQRYQKRKYYSRAIRHYKYAIRENPSFTEAYANLGYCYARKQIYDKAEENLKKAIELQDDFVPAYQYLGEVYLETGNPTAAKAIYEQLKALDAEAAAALLAEIQNYQER
jgi:tetratricopeptide (TPR) repeat protein